MRPIYLTARYRVKRESIEKVRNAVCDLVRYVKLHEPGITSYTAGQEVLDPYSFQHVIVFENEAALKIHQSSKASELFVNAVYPETLEPLEFKEYNLTAVK